MSYWPATAWTVTDPSAPPRPAIDSTADGKRRPPAWMPHILRPYCRNRLRRGAFLALCGGALALAAPGPIAFVLGVPVSALIGMRWMPAPAIVAWCGAALIGLVVVAGLTGLATALVGERRDERARRHASEQREQARQWDTQFQLHRGQLPAGPVREQADRLVAAVAAFEATRTYRDGWAGQNWAHTLHVRRWSLLSRLSDSAAVRTDLAEAAGLAERTPELERVAAERSADIAALDAELADTIEQLDQLTAQARELDAALETAEAARAERDRADQLTCRLGAAPSTADELDAQHRRIRDQVLIEAPEGDLSILNAGLHALTRHITDQNSNSNSNGNEARQR